MIRRLLASLALLPLIQASAMAQPSRATISATLNYNALQPGQQEVIAIVVDIKAGFHAQSHAPLDKNLVAFEVKLEAHPNITFLAPSYPPGEVHDYPMLGKLSVYTGQAIIYVPLEVKADAPPGPITIKGTASYQICDDSQCFAPEDTSFQIDTQVIAAGQPLQVNQPDLFKGFDPTTFVKTDVKLFGFELNRDQYLFAFAAAILVGMIFNVMPCVLPIVPLKAMGFYQAAQENRARSFALGVSFALGIVVTFGILAIPVVVKRWIAWGELFGIWWFVAAIVILLLIMALQTFGVFDFVLPTKVYEFTPSHDTYIGNFLFGMLTAVLSTPCTFGMFLGLLVWAATQPPVIGTALVMNVGLGMALPYLVLAAFPELARGVPRSGPWAAILKQMMAFLLLGTAIYFARSFLPEAAREDAFWWILFAVVVAAGLFLIARTAQLVKRTKAVIVASIIALLLIAPSLVVARKLTYHPVPWVRYSQERFEEAMKSGKPVLVKFTADWCGNCQWVEGTVYTDDRTVEAVKQQQIIAIKSDLTKRDAPGWALLRSLHPVGAIPFTAVYLPAESSPRKLAGVYTTDDLLDALKRD